MTDPLPLTDKHSCGHALSTAQGFWLLPAFRPARLTAYPHSPKCCLFLGMYWQKLFPSKFSLLPVDICPPPSEPSSSQQIHSKRQLFSNSSHSHSFFLPFPRPARTIIDLIYIFIRSSSSFKKKLNSILDLKLDYHTVGETVFRALQKDVTGITAVKTKAWLLNSP